MPPVVSGAPAEMPFMIADIVIMAGLACLSALLVGLMVKLGKLDRPGPRSSHVVPTPKGGGVGIVVCFVVGSMTFALRHGLSGGVLSLLACLVLAAGSLAAIAFLDDLFDWSFTIKLTAQVVAAVFIVVAGCRIELATGWLDGSALVIIAVCWLVFVTNAMNFIDGLNGLASGVTLLAALFVTLAAIPSGTMLIAAPAMALAAGITGFLPFNYPTARIFMGDVGSQLCGYVIGALGILLSSRADLPGGRLLVPMVLCGVLFDVVFTLCRRAYRRSRLTEAHREHLYQLAQRSGMRASLVTLVHWGMAVWGGLCAFSLKPYAGLADFVEVAVLVLAPQLLWLSYVTARTRNTLPT